jgi:hypothetical protein
MKPFSLFKLPVLLLGFGAVLVLSPACKAQSEVNPDHFDGTDSWVAAALRPVPASKAKQSLAQANLQAQNGKAASGPTVQLAVSRELSKPVRPEAVAIPDKRKTAPRKADKD